MAARPARNPFDHVEKPSRSLFERVDSSTANNNSNNGGRGRYRSDSPDGRVRRSNVDKPAPEHIDRYVPGRDSRSPMPRTGGRGSMGRRPGARREDSGRRDGAPARGGQVRPKKTYEQLDEEMEDYWGDGATSATNGAGTAQNTSNTAAAEVVDDVDMIE